MPDLQTTDSVVTLLERIADGINAQRAEGLGPREAAAYCGCSLAKWHDLHNRGLCPAASYLSERLPVWPRSELKAWLWAGAPPLAKWRMMRDAAIRRSA